MQIISYSEVFRTHTAVMLREQIARILPSFQLLKR